jgi:hypothetical protein
LSNWSSNIIEKWEVLRMEVRLNKRQKLKQLFAKLNIKAEAMQTLARAE